MSSRALAGVLGHPVGHSLSPAMHNAAFGAVGLDWTYVKLPVPPDHLAEVVAALPASGYRGANVTIPHKLAALELADEASPAADAIGAANTLSFRDGVIAADNTDASGLIDAIDAPVAGQRALVLGAGGAGRAAAWALREAGAAEVLVWNRTEERAAALAREMGATKVGRLEAEAVDLVVNATSVGLDAAVDEDDALAELGLAAQVPPGLVVDLVYRADGGDTPVLAWARRGGARAVDGIEVLVRQGGRSFELWTGRPAPLDVMREAARSAPSPA